MELKKNIIVHDASNEEIIPFQNGVNHTAAVPFELVQRRENIRFNLHRNGKAGELRRVINYFKGGFSLFLHRNRFANIICWQQFYGLTFGFFCNLFHVRSSCRIIVCNYTYKKKHGLIGKIYLRFMKKCLAGGVIDYIHILSPKYADRVCCELGFDRSRVITAPFGIPDEMSRCATLETPAGFNKNGYFLAIGRSNRDYDFLLEVWKGIDYPLVIISDVYLKKTDNINVVIRNDVGADEQYGWISNCRANILCLDDGNIASGDTVLLTAMSLSKINIVSRPSTLAEMYIEDQVNAIAVDKNEDDFRKTVTAVIEGRFDYIIPQARESFLSCFSRESMGKRIGEYVKGE